MNDLVRIKVLLEGLREYIRLKAPFPEDKAAMRFCSTIGEILNMTDSVISEVNRMILKYKDDMIS